MWWRQLLAKMENGLPDTFKILGPTATTSPVQATNSQTEIVLKCMEKKNSYSYGRYQSVLAL